MTAGILSCAPRSDIGASPDRVAPASTWRTRRDSLDTSKRFERIAGSEGGATIDWIFSAAHASARRYHTETTSGRSNP
jgi:hypothetical protein